jgi:uncharacterized protein YjbJ (UPF0337 family)
MTMFEETKGTVQNLAGKVQDAVGDMTGDSGTQAEGKVRQFAGAAQQQYGEALNQVRESAVSNPAATVAVVAGLGFVLGALWARR